MAETAWRDPCCGARQARSLESSRRPGRRCAPSLAAIASLAAAIAPGAAVAQPAPAQPPPGRISLVARFALEVSSPERIEKSRGRLALFPDGRVCILVDAPVRQRVLLTRELVLVYYPDGDILMRGKVRRGQVPPVLDAIAVGVGDPARLLPANATVLERDRADGVLTTRWGFGRGASEELRIAEARDGVRRIEIVAPGGRLRRRYEFRDRVAAGGRLVPRYIRGDYRDSEGRPSRLEEWALSEVGGAATEALGRECAVQVSARDVQEMAW